MKVACIRKMLILFLCSLLAGCGKGHRAMEGTEKNCQIGILKDIYGMAEEQALLNRQDVCTAFTTIKWGASDIERVRGRIQFIESHAASKESRGVIKIRCDKVAQKNLPPEIIAYVAKWFRSDDGRPILLALDSEGKIQNLTAEPTWPSMDLEKTMK